MFKTNWPNYLGAAVILILVLLAEGSGSLARAATIDKIEIEAGGKKIAIIGSCFGQSAAVRILSATSSEPFYTAGSPCRDHKFDFQDDLSYWKLPPGPYRVRIYDDNGPLTSPSSEETFSLDQIPPEAQANSNEPVTIETPYQTLDEGTEQAPNHSEVDMVQAPGFLSRIIAAIVDWFKSAIVMIKELVAEKITTPEICLGETCLIENQLKELLGKNQISSTTTEFIK